MTTAAGGGVPTTRYFGRRSTTSAGVEHFPALVDVTGLGGTLVATRASRLRHSHQLPHRPRYRLRPRCHRRARQTPSRPRRQLHRLHSRYHRRTQSRRRPPLLRHRFRTPSRRRFPLRNLRQQARAREARLPTAQTADRPHAWATPFRGGYPLLSKLRFFSSKLNA